MKNVKQQCVRKYMEADGELACVEGMHDIPFFIRRSFIISHIPKGNVRANHASRKSYFFYWVLNGSVIIKIDNGIESQVFQLNSKNSDGLLVPPMHWIRVMNLEENASLLVLADTVYEKGDYLEDYEQFLREKGVKMHENNNSRSQ